MTQRCRRQEHKCGCLVFFSFLNRHHVELENWRVASESLKSDIEVRVFMCYWLIEVCTIKQIMEWRWSKASKPHKEPAQHASLTPETCPRRPAVLLVLPKSSSFFVFLSLNLSYYMIFFFSPGENKCKCQEIPQIPLTVDPLSRCPENTTYFRYTCIEGYVRKAGTSNRINCNQINGAWTTPLLQCIREIHLLSLQNVQSSLPDNALSYCKCYICMRTGQ